MLCDNADVVAAAVQPLDWSHSCDLHVCRQVLVVQLLPCIKKHICTDAYHCPVYSQVASSNSRDLVRLMPPNSSCGMPAQA